MSSPPPPPEKRPAEGELESERQKRMKVIFDLKDSLLLRAPDAGFDPTTLFSLIDDFVLRSDGLYLDTHTWNQVKEKLDTLIQDLYTHTWKTFIQGMINMTQDMINFFQKDPLPAADESMMKIDETEKPMRLLISNGYEICVVDIKQPKDNTRSGVDYLPKIATLKLAEEQLPVSVGLFRLGSDAYMIGGQTLPAKLKATDPNVSGYDAYSRLLVYHYAKGTSSDTYSLSITNNGTLFPSKCNRLKLESPKLWPVVADIDGKLHVIDSFPSNIKIAHRAWIFSHEVISDGNLLSLTIEPPCVSS